MKEKTGSPRAFRITGIVLKCIVTAIAALLLIYNIYVLVARLAFGIGIPTVFGFGFATVETGSMAPTINAGDFIVIHAEDRYETNDIVTYYDSSRSQYVTHRIIYVSDSGYVTKGDANNAQDNMTVTDGDIVGKVVLVAGGVGAFISFLQSPFGLLVAVGMCALIWAVFTYVPALIFGKKDEETEKTDTERQDENENGEKKD